jgi:inosine-uridine nucleoside N-ribohydrolase
MSFKKILLIGLDPAYVDFSQSASGRTQESVISTSSDTYRELTEKGFEVHNCILTPNENAGFTVKKVLSTNQFESVMIGGALRALPIYTLLFEEIINIIHQEAPTCTFCFNTGPETTIAAILRSMKQ